jgi:hypothetical protein
MPIFAMKSMDLSTGILGTDLHVMQPSTIGEELIESYQKLLLKETLRVVGSEVLIIKDSEVSSEEPVVKELGYPFVRDPVIALADQKLLIYTEGNIPFGALDIIAQIQEHTDYDLIQIKNAYFEGGNTIYSSRKKIFLHGLEPVGNYFEANFCHKMDPELTNESLKKTLAPRGISVHGLELNPIFNRRKNRIVHANYYYHLDCFMQVLPSGKILILNKNILSDASRNKMEELFGEDFIDLAYPEYLTSPILFNFIAVQKLNQIVLISSRLPESILRSLYQIDLTVITPDILDPGSLAYDGVFSSQVALLLNQEGYATATGDNLTSHVPKNIHGYYLDNGFALPPDLRDVALGEHGESLDAYYSEPKNKVSFTLRCGGCHCLVSDVAPTFVEHSISPVSVTTNNVHHNIGWNKAVFFSPNQVSPAQKTATKASGCCSLM